MLNFEEQKQRTLSGLMYNDLTPELVEARRVAVELTNAVITLPMVSRRRSVSHCYERFWERWARMYFLSRPFGASLVTISK